MPTLTALCGESTGRTARAIDKVLAHADCQSAIQPIDNRRYRVAQTGSLLYRRLLTGYGCATICANFVNGPVEWWGGAPPRPHLPPIKTKAHRGSPPPAHFHNFPQPL